MIKQMSISEARKKMTTLEDELSSEDTISVTNHGKEVFAILRWDTYEAIAETLDILTDEEALAELKTGLSQLKKNELVDFEEFKKSSMYKIKLTRVAAENLKRLDVKTQTQLIHRIEELKHHPDQLGKQLKGPLRDLRSLRAVGQRYRVIYRIFEEDVLVVVIALGIRKDGDKKDIYELMKKYLRTGLLDD